MIRCCLCSGVFKLLGVDFTALVLFLLLWQTSLMEKDDLAVWHDIGRRIRHLRLSRVPKMTVDDLAEKAGVVRQQIIRLEAGLTGTPVVRLRAIADALGVPLSDLLEEEQKARRSQEMDLLIAFRGQGLSDEEIDKILDYISLIKHARG